MDILFESSFVKDYKWSREAYFFIRRKFVIFSSLLISLYLALAVWRGVDDVRKAAPIIAIAVALVLAYVYITVKSIRLPINADIAKYGATVTICVRAAQDKLISSKSSGDTVEIEYGRLVKMKQSKNYLYLISDAKIFFCVPKSNFSVGDYDSFVKFLGDKGIK